MMLKPIIPGVGRRLPRADVDRWLPETTLNATMQIEARVLFTASRRNSQVIDMRNLETP
jgi:hypothetical protein